MSQQDINQCLAHTTVMVFGDSNGVRLKQTFESLLQTDDCSCKHCIHGPHGLHWNVHHRCPNKDIGSLLTFDPHEYHLYLSGSFWPLYSGGSIPSHIDTLPTTGRYIVIVHYFLHVLGAHLSVVHNRLLALKAACLRLWRRNPGVVVAFRGPHVMHVGWKVNHSLGGYVQGSLYYKLIMDVFLDVRDKVIFLDGWDMAAALENGVIHPTDNVPGGMANLLLSFICR